MTVFKIKKKKKKQSCPNKMHRDQTLLHIVCLKAHTRLVCCGEDLVIRLRRQICVLRVFPVLCIGKSFRQIT